MKNNKQPTGLDLFGGLAFRSLKSFRNPIGSLLAVLALFCATTGLAQDLIWDPGNTNNGAIIDPGSASWDTDTTTNFNWNNGSVNVSWVQGGTATPTAGARFVGPNAPAGTYVVNIDGGQVAATNLTISANGYLFSNSPIYLNYTSGNTSMTNYALLLVGDGVSVTFSNNVTGNNGASELRLGSNGAPATAIFAGTVTGFQDWFTSTNQSTFYLENGGSCGSLTINANVRLTGGTWGQTGAAAIGRGRTCTEPTAQNGSLTIDGPSTIWNQSGDYLYMGRDVAFSNATLTVQNGGTLNINSGCPGIGLPRPASSQANAQSWMVVHGGTVNMGSVAPIFLLNGGGGAGEVAVLTQDGGTILAGPGIEIGGSGTFNATCAAFVTNSGGFLYLGAQSAFGGIGYGSTVPATTTVQLSGGTVGALQSWHSSVPLLLATLNGNITFQCADNNGGANNISLTGALTGPGGLNVTGGGTLTIGGASQYAGSTVVSNGTLVVQTGAMPTNGPLTVDATLGNPQVSVQVASPGQHWSIGGLTFYSNGNTPTMDFNFVNGLTPSTTAAAVQVAGNVAFTVTPNVTVDGSAIPVGTFPLISYTGTVSGVLPTSVSINLAGGSATGSLVNNSATKTINLVVTQSTYNPAIKWGVGNGLWDTTSLNWLSNSAAAKYKDPDAVIFDDTASGTSPITVTVSTTVSPGSIGANNATKSYIVTNSAGGVIAGPGAVSVLGGGSLTLAGANTYTGGTTVTGPGQLNINYGGNGGASSAIGTGVLNVNNNAIIDNTSGQAVALNTTTPIPVNFNGSWTFNGTTNLDLGLGDVTLNAGSVVVTVVSNRLSMGNRILENSLGSYFVKQGAGSLTLSNVNGFTGGFTLIGGTVNINEDGALGTGLFDVEPSGTNVAAFDNTSGATVILGSNTTPPNQIDWTGNILFKGTTNLDLGGPLVYISAPTLTVASNTLFTEGVLNGHNTGVMTYNGPGTWDIGGTASDTALTLVINSGTVLFDKSSGQAMNGSTVTVNTNATLIMAQPTGNQIASSASVVLTGGTMDMKGDSENVNAVTFNSGILKNSTAGTASALPVAAVTVSGAGCVFQVDTADSTLTVSNVVGSGGIVVEGAGQVILTTNGYSGNTTISNGTLVVSYPSFSTNSTITITTNAVLGTNGVLNLNFAVAATNTVNALILGGVSRPAGIYSATTDPAYISGTGSLQVVPVSTINPLPGPIQFTVSGSTLALSWPTNLGWILQSQTNTLGKGLGTNWADVAGSASTTSTSVTLVPTNPAVFFRLHHP